MLRFERPGSKPCFKEHKGRTEPESFLNKGVQDSPCFMITFLWLKRSQTKKADWKFKVVLILGWSNTIFSMCFYLVLEIEVKKNKSKQSPAASLLHGPIYFYVWSILLSSFCTMLYWLPGEKTQRFTLQWIFLPCALFGSFMTVQWLHFGCCSLSASELVMHPFVTGNILTSFCPAVWTGLYVSNLGDCCALSSVFCFPFMMS